MLVAVTDRPEPGILFTVRREDMRTHAGQVAFPGGRIDPQDEDAASAALREAWEELALDPALVTLVRHRRPLSHRHRLRGHSGRRRHSAGPAARPRTNRKSPTGSKRLWPSSSIPPTRQRSAAEFRGRTRHYFQIDWNGRKIWGATAAMLVNLSRRLKW